MKELLELLAKIAKGLLPKVKKGPKYEPILPKNDFLASQPTV